MRKYRGMTKDGWWVDGGYYHDGAFPFIIAKSDRCLFWRVLPETVGQSIDLKDKNADEIFEGMTIEGIHKTTKEKITGKIVWREKSFGWGIKMGGWAMGLECLTDCYDIEIIHENGDLPK
jgi:hypothetical protein